MALKFINLAGVRSARGEQSKSGIYDNIKKGLLPPPVKLGASSVWIESEIETVNRAIIAGSNHDEIRDLVKQLVASRTADARYEDTANVQARQGNHAAGTHPTTIARRDSTRRKATIREDVQ